MVGKVNFHAECNGLLLTCVTPWDLVHGYMYRLQDQSLASGPRKTSRPSSSDPEWLENEMVLKLRGSVSEKTNMQAILLPF